MSERKVMLAKQEGASDKVYMLHLKPSGAGWVVERGNARRGQPLRMGFVVDKPVDLGVAISAFEKKLKEQLREGYKISEGDAGPGYDVGEAAGEASGHRQQLPTAISDQRARELIDDAMWCLQLKANGERRSVEVTPDGQVRGINKLGLYTPIPTHWVHAFGVLAAEGGALIDGEQIGDVLHAFDVLHFNVNDLRNMGFEMRAKQLDRMLAHHGDRLASVLKPLPVYGDAASKASAVAAIKARNDEGVVFKRKDAPYSGGRSEDALKWKFTETATCVVTVRNAQRSVGIALLDAAGQLRPVGNVTIPANHEPPEPGHLVEVALLYYNPRGGLEQPVYLGRRNDVLRDECHFGQILRLKPGVQMPVELWNAGAGQQLAAAGDSTPKPAQARARRMAP